MNKPELLRTIGRIKSQLERGETHMSRIMADEVFSVAETAQLEHEQMLILTAPYAFHPETNSESFIRFTQAWMKTLVNLHRHFGMQQYLEKVLWICRLLIRNGLSNRAYELLLTLHHELTEVVPDQFDKLLKDHSSFPGFERYYPLLIPEMQLKS